MWSRTMCDDQTHCTVRNVGQRTKVPHTNIYMPSSYLQMPYTTKPPDTPLTNMDQL